VCEWDVRVGCASGMCEWDMRVGCASGVCEYVRVRCAGRCARVVSGYSGAILLYGYIFKTKYTYANIHSYINKYMHACVHMCDAIVWWGEQAKQHEDAVAAEKHRGRRSFRCFSIAQ
jgi:hypothetical protein